MAGTTNFIQFNPNQINQETDAQYTADQSRSGGFATDAIVPSPLLNKALYQASTMSAALGEMLASKGFAVTDANLPALVSALANIITTADQRAQLTTVPFASTMAFNAASSNGFQVALTASCTFTISGQTPGQIITLVFQQPATGAGGFGVSFPPNVIGAGSLDLTLNAINIQSFFVCADGNLRALTPMTVLSN